MATIERAAIIGGGVIGAGWIARFIENGIDVDAYDPAADAVTKVEAVLENSRYAYNKLVKVQRRQEGSVTFRDSLFDAVSNAHLIVESVPERLEIKRSVYSEIERHADPDAIIVSSTSGIMPSELQSEMTTPERLLVAHPFNPVYLLPLVELVGGRRTSPSVIDRAKAFYESIGMRPLLVKKEIEAFIADRLLEAVWRESLWLVKDGVATTEDIDDAVRFGFGLRYAQMGVFDTYRVAGGEAGMRHFMEQFGPCLKWPWSKLTDVPEFNKELVDLITTQSDEQSGHLSIREMERIRDDNLIDILSALKGNNWGAGKTLANHEVRLLEAANDPH
jgi:carnitine 3-dehydrogenase